MGVLTALIRRDADMFAVRKITSVACFVVLSQALVAASSTPESQIAEWILREGGRVPADRCRLGRNDD
jgi:hypothetical protein